MPLSVKLEPIEDDIRVLMSQDLGPEARSAALAQAAAAALKEIESEDEAELGRVPSHRTFVDGAEDAPLESVKPEGEIEFDFDLMPDLFRWIAGQLELHSPHGPSGRYEGSHILFIDGAPADPDQDVPAGFTEAVFLNTVPYARKIEKGESKQAPDGVYQAVAVLAQQRFGDLAKIEFAYRPASGAAPASLGRGRGRRSRSASARDAAQPAIVITRSAAP